MFGRITRLPLRRCLHTASSNAHSAAPGRMALGRVGRVALGASMVATALVSYNLASEKSKIHLDSPSSSATKTSASKSSSAPTSSSTTSSSSSAASSSSASASSAEPKSIPSEEGSLPKSDEEDGDKTTSGGSAGGQQGAYNPETGEINWDCPCLGGMAHGPCGEQFKEAFSCFVHSEEEPKGINCVEAFKRMQDCFREHPEVYADEIMDDDDDEDPSRPSPDSPEGKALEKVEDVAAEVAPATPEVSQATKEPKTAAKKGRSDSVSSIPSH